LTSSRAGRSRRVARVVSAGGVLAVVACVHACVEAPPKISAIPPSGLSLRVYAFGASAQDARRAFEAIHQNNTQFTVVNQGGDGEILVGLENDSPKCVPPTALCEMKISFRVRDNKGETLHAATTTVSASSDRCSEICSKALINVAVKVVEAAAGVLKTGAASDASVETVEGGAGEMASANEAGAPAVDAGASASGASTTSGASSASGASGSGARGSKKGGAKAAEPPAKPPPAICSVGTGPRLPAEEAEKRAAQVEVLKRLNLLDQEEYDCLRKAYLARL